MMQPARHWHKLETLAASSLYEETSQSVTGTYYVVLWSIRWKIAIIESAKVRPLIDYIQSGVLRTYYVHFRTTT